jgi:glycosyltransferase involved in cell wall biosynthesis
MRTVLQIIPSLDSGGTERTAIEIAAALTARGDRALVASEGGRLEADLAALGGELVRLPVASKNPLVMAMNVGRLRALIRREKVDLVHARSRAPAWSGFFASRLTGKPFVTTFHGIYSEKSAAKRVYNSVMARGDAVIANSLYSTRIIRARYSTPNDRIVVIPSGIDLARFDPAAVDETRRATLRAAWGLTGGERVILGLARLTGWKGQSVLIDAAALPPLSGRPDVVVILAGEEQGREGYRRQLEAAIAAQGLAGRVRLVGHCEDAPAAFALADVAVAAATAPEGFGRTAIEAAAMGVPVVGTALGATEETVLAPPNVPAAERTGWLVPPGRPDMLAAALAEALDIDPRERAGIAARGRAHAQRFSAEAMRRLTLAVYDRLLGPQGATGS